MSRANLFAALSLFLSLSFGCATGGGSPGDDPSVSPPPTEVKVLDYHRTLLPREGYIAKFEIVPRVGAALLYPTREEDIEKVGSGTHHLQGILPPFVKAQRDLYDPRATGLLNEAPGAIDEVTMLVVLSDEPLNLEPFLGNPAALRTLLGGSFNDQHAAIREILRVVIPIGGAASCETGTGIVRVPRGWEWSG